MPKNRDKYRFGQSTASAGSGSLGSKLTYAVRDTDSPS